jgi:hypothetical protein
MMILNPFRWASVLFVLNAVGHTLGAVITVPQFGPSSDAVVSMMQSVHLNAQGSDCTWYGFYRGFGYFVSFYMLLSALLAWWLGGMTERTRGPFLPVAWALFAVSVANVPLMFIYFFPVPMVFSSVIAVLLGIGCISQAKKRSADREGELGQRLK